MKEGRIHHCPFIQQSHTRYPSFIHPFIHHVHNSANAHDRNNIFSAEISPRSRSTSIGPTPTGSRRQNRLDDQSPQPRIHHQAPLVPRRRRRGAIPRPPSLAKGRFRAAGAESGPSRPTGRTRTANLEAFAESA